MGGQWEHIVYPKHDCDLSECYSGYEVGSVWQCDCGQKWLLYKKTRWSGRPRYCKMTYQ